MKIVSCTKIEYVEIITNETGWCRYRRSPDGFWQHCIGFGDNAVPCSELKQKELERQFQKIQLFLCDVCGLEKTGERFPVFDENWNKEKDLNQCSSCFKKHCIR